MKVQCWGPVCIWKSGVVVVVLITNRSGWLLELLTELIRKHVCSGKLTQFGADKKSQQIDWLKLLVSLINKDILEFQIVIPFSINIFLSNLLKIKAFQDYVILMEFTNDLQPDTFCIKTWKSCSPSPHCDWKCEQLSPSPRRKRKEHQGPREARLVVQDFCCT